MKRLGMTILAAALAAGCQTAPTSRYGDVDDDIYGRKDKMEYTQQSRSVTEAIEAMLTDPDFTDFYKLAKKRAKARGHVRPVVIVDKIEAGADPETTNYEATSQMRTELKEALRKTKKFLVVDLQERALMTGTVIADVDGGAAGGNLDSYNGYAAGEFVMAGELKQTSTGGSYFHFFNLRMTDTASGVETWNETVRIRKD
jgi:PBP1b-binding outer membrane lipoprotein LpoB